MAYRPDVRLVDCSPAALRPPRRCRLVSDARSFTWGAITAPELPTAIGKVRGSRVSLERECLAPTPSLPERSRRFLPWLNPGVSAPRFR